jgi:4-diphosphocytidyl-2C-methyl-D-erythritol kinase
MFGTGRGDVLEEFDLHLADYEIRVEVPQGVHVSTSEAYSRVIPRDRIARPSLREALRYPVEMWPEVLFNDFESFDNFAEYSVLPIKMRSTSDGFICFFLYVGEPEWTLLLYDCFHLGY